MSWLEKQNIIIFFYFCAGNIYGGSPLLITSCSIKINAQTFDMNFVYSQYLFLPNCLMSKKRQHICSLRDRYSTEPHKPEKNIERNSSKIASISSSTYKKNHEPKHLHIFDCMNRINFRDGEFQVGSFTTFSRKKTSFVVTKRKGNKSILSEMSNKLDETKWIQEVESDSYHGLRDYNEDRIVVKQDLKIKDEVLNLFAVFDGHAGSSASEYLKLNFAKTFEGFATNFQIQQALKKSIEQMENKIIKNGLKIPSGSCATVLVIKDDSYWALNVGDSRILVVKDFEEYKQITEDHKPENLKEYKRIEGLGAKIYRTMIINEQTNQKAYGPYRVMPSRLSVTRAIGDYLIKKNQKQSIITAAPDLFSGRLESDDTFLLVSDGAYEQFSNAELAIIFSHQSHLSLRQRMNNFMTEARKRGTNDNTSLIAIQVKHSKNKSAKTSAGSTMDPSFSKIQIKL